MKIKRCFFYLVACADAVLIVLSSAMGFSSQVCYYQTAAHTLSTQYGWYYMPRTDGLQPEENPEFSFIKNYSVLSVGSPDEKVIYITFDAGYENGYAGKILDTLKAHNAQAAFFLVGHYIKANPDIVMRMVNEGHVVCSHSMNHMNMARMSDYTEVSKELVDLETLFKEQTGKQLAKFFRPPEGNFSERLLQYAQDCGYTTVFWSFAYNDWKNDSQPSAEDAFDTIISRTHPGEIALLHLTPKRIQWCWTPCLPSGNRWVPLRKPLRSGHSKRAGYINTSARAERRFFFCLDSRGTIRMLKLKKGERMDAAGLLLKWYSENKRDLPWRHTRDPYAILVSEMMLQQTRVDTVVGYYVDFMKRFPDVFSLAAASEADVLNAWKGLGYYSRARNLHRSAKLVAECGGVFPKELEEWRALPGVGAYIAGAVMSIALGKPCAAVDGNVLRVITRMDGIYLDVASPAARSEVETRVYRMMPADRASDFTQALMDLGALVCKPVSPECARCPVAPLCAALSADAIQKLPVKTARNTPREVRLALAAVICEGMLLMEHRCRDKLLGGMWGLPAVELEEDQTPEALFYRQYALKLCSGQTIGNARHTFTHQRWMMDIRLYRAEQRFYVKEGMEWVPLDKIDIKPVPKAFQKGIDILLKVLQEENP